MLQRTRILGTLCSVHRRGRLRGSGTIWEGVSFSKKAKNGPGNVQTASKPIFLAGGGRTKNREGSDSQPLPLLPSATRCTFTCTITNLKHG